MASKAPPIPPAQRSRMSPGVSPKDDITPDVKQDPAGGDADVNLKEQDRYGGIHQNITHQGRQQDR